jgi:hemolysin activation/secretion protein
LFRLGGSQSIRGFDEESIYASSYLLTSAELRLSLDNATQWFVFFDKLMYKSFIYTDNPWGIGVGAELNTGAGLFFISYALGSQFNQSLEFRNSKIHFGYRNRF